MNEVRHLAFPGFADASPEAPFAESATTTSFGQHLEGMSVLGRVKWYPYSTSQSLNC